jgi:hypothetical protein
MKMRGFENIFKLRIKRKICESKRKQSGFKFIQ